MLGCYTNHVNFERFISFFCILKLPLGRFHACHMKWTDCLCGGCSQFDVMICKCQWFGENLLQNHDNKTLVSLWLCCGCSFLWWSSSPWQMNKLRLFVLWVYVHVVMYCSHTLQHKQNPQSLPVTKSVAWITKTMVGFFYSFRIVTSSLFKWPTIHTHDLRLGQGCPSIYFVSSRNNRIHVLFSHFRLLI